MIHPLFLTPLPLLLTTLTTTLIPTPSPPQRLCPNSNPPPSANFSLYVLSLQWPFTVCTTTNSHTSSCHPPPAAFTIRGLWPTSFQPGKSPTCCDYSFSLSPILDIAPTLNRFWPDFSPANDAADLWEAQWLKHGSCSGLGLRSYFRKVLELSRRYDFLRSLNAAGVIVASMKPHAAKVLQKAVSDATGGFRVEMRCAYSGDEVYLEAIQVCLHKTNFETIHCPSQCLDGVVRCCGENDIIRIPYWTHRGGQAGGMGGQGFRDDDAQPEEGLWIGHVAGLIALAAGLAFWLFKQFWDHDGRATPLRNQYQRLW